MPFNLTMTNILTPQPRPSLKPGLEGGRTAWGPVYCLLPLHSPPCLPQTPGSKGLVLPTVSRPRDRPQNAPYRPAEGTGLTEAPFEITTVLAEVMQSERRGNSKAALFPADMRLLANFGSWNLRALLQSAQRSRTLPSNPGSLCLPLTQGPTHMAISKVPSAYPGSFFSLRHFP